MDTRTFIVIPASDVPVALAEFRQRHIHACAVIPLHTTLVAPFLSLRDLEREGLAQLRQLAADMSPFRYYASSICVFPTSNALWLAPAPAAPFEYLAQAVYERFPHVHREVGYPTYHMTVGLTRTPDDLREVIREFQTTFAASLPMSFVARELAVYVDVEGDYQLFSELPMGGT